MYLTQSGMEILSISVHRDCGAEKKISQTAYFWIKMYSHIYPHTTKKNT